MENNNVEKQVKVQRTIIALLIVVIVALTIGVTFAWYTRRADDVTNIVFSDPVNIYITGKTDNLKEPIVITSGKILPGNKVKIKAGIQLGTEEVGSSDAYVRVRLSVVCDEVLDDYGNPLKENLIENNTVNPVSDEWKKVDFKDADGNANEWFVLCVKNNDVVGDARIVKNLEHELFYDNYLVINNNLDNRYANANIRITFEVEAIQSENVQNPLLDANNPTWGVSDSNI